MSDIISPTVKFQAPYISFTFQHWQFASIWYHVWHYIRMTKVHVFPSAVCASFLNHLFSQQTVCLYTQTYCLPSKPTLEPDYKRIWNSVLKRKDKQCLDSSEQHFLSIKGGLSEELERREKKTLRPDYLFIINYKWDFGGRGYQLLKGG